MGQRVGDPDDPENDTNRRADDPDRTPEMILMTLIMILIEPKSGADQYHVIPIAGEASLTTPSWGRFGCQIGVTRRIDACFEWFVRCISSPGRLRVHSQAQPETAIAADGRRDRCERMSWPASPFVQTCVRHPDYL
jgi:hypothetical protein